MSNLTSFRCVYEAEFRKSDSLIQLMSCNFSATKTIILQLYILSISGYEPGRRSEVFSRIALFRAKEITKRIIFLSVGRPIVPVGRQWSRRFDRVQLGVTSFIARNRLLFIQYWAGSNRMAVRWAGATVVWNDGTHAPRPPRTCGIRGGNDCETDEADCGYGESWSFRKCFLRSKFRQNPLPQTWHVNGFLSLCVCMWNVKLYTWIKMNKKNDKTLY